MKKRPGRPNTAVAIANSKTTRSPGKFSPNLLTLRGILPQLVAM